MRKDQFEEMYGIRIVLEEEVGRSNYYGIITADGKIFATHLRSMIAVEAECKKNGAMMLEIKNSVEGKKNA